LAACVILSVKNKLYYKQSIAYISSEDGDIAVNCKLVKTGLQSIS